MKEIFLSNIYRKWYKKLSDIQAKHRIFIRVKRLAEGNPGDCRFLGDGVSELRIDYGLGYRVYYKDTGKEIIILLCGGDKTTQQADIKRAKQLARENIEEDNENK
jgi:putative addiction module killer protein